MKREKIEDKVFVSLVNNLSALSENTNENELDSKKINGAYTYKLEMHEVLFGRRERLRASSIQNLSRFNLPSENTQYFIKLSQLPVS